MRPARVSRALAVAGLLTVALAAPAAAFELNGGCTLELTSTDAAGAPLDTASGGPDGGVGGTEQDPFLIDWDGQVAWVGSSGDQVFTNHSWGVSVFNVPTPLMGGDPNEGEATTAEGSTGVSENAPFKFTGLYNVSGQINGEGGTHCDGSGWFKIQGNPLETIPFWVAVGVALIGLVLMLSSRGSTVPVAGTTAPPLAAPPPPTDPLPADTPPADLPPADPPPTDLPREDQP